MKNGSVKNIALITLLISNLVTGAAVVFMWPKMFSSQAGKVGEIKTPRKPASTLPSASAYRESIVKVAVRERRLDLENCYNEFLAQKPSTADGVLRVHWTIDNTGDVRSAEILDSDIKDEHLETCVLDQIKSWRFQPPPDGEATVVAHKFTFRPKSPTELEQD